MKILLTFFLVPFLLFSKVIETFYGDIEVEEPVLLELIESSSFQRLKDVRQYGVSYYLTHKEEYTRYEHSLGVFALLRDQNRSLKEQIAGLLHDASHTVFSHVGDFIFPQEGEDDDYQNSIHAEFLEKSGLGKILNKHGFTVEEVLPEEELFPALETPGPNLCADRIDYNIQGAYYQGFITKEEGRLIFKDLQFIDGTWRSTLPSLMRKISESALFMTRTCWGSAMNYLASELLAESLLRALEIHLISMEDIHFGTDQVVWDCLINTEDSLIQQKMRKLLNLPKRDLLVDSAESNFHIQSKFRGINPLIFFQGEIIRLTDLDLEFSKEYQRVENLMKQGWYIQR